MYARLAAILTVVALMTGGLAVADTLLIDKVERSETEQPSRPLRGATMEMVQKNFGAPIARRDAVGDPPITRWEYGDFLVFFEYDRVIDTVERAEETQD